MGLQSGFTSWNDANLRYLAFVCNMREVKGDSESDEKATYTAAFNYGPFAGSVLILHGSGNPIDAHHVIAFNEYLDQAFVTKAVVSKEGFVKYWSDYKIRVGGHVSSVPSPYKYVSIPSCFCAQEQFRPSEAALPTIENTHKNG